MAHAALSFIEILNQWRPGECITLFERPLPGPGRAVALAPHPDDPDTVSVCLKMLFQGGWDVHWTILTSAWSGVEDEFVGPDRLAKSSARMEEQLASARVFQSPPAQLLFLQLDEDEDGSLAETEENYVRYAQHLDSLAPDVVLLPWARDSNASHRLNYRWLARWASGQSRRVIALGNEDPKTTEFVPNLQIIFRDDLAAWKATLLECHKSQTARNKRTRGISFAERILQVNAACPGLQPGEYAERFQIEVWNPRGQD